jgi:hypothetical protein
LVVVKNRTPTPYRARTAIALPFRTPKMKAAARQGRRFLLIEAVVRLL